MTPPPPRSAEPSCSLILRLLARSLPACVSLPPAHSTAAFPRQCLSHPPLRPLTVQSAAARSSLVAPSTHEDEVGAPVAAASERRFAVAAAPVAQIPERKWSLSYRHDRAVASLHAPPRSSSTDLSCKYNDWLQLLFIAIPFLVPSSFTNFEGDWRRHVRVQVLLRAYVLHVYNTHNKLMIGSSALLGTCKCWCDVLVAQIHRWDFINDKHW